MVSLVLGDRVGGGEGMGSGGNSALIVMGIRLLAMSLVDMVGNSMGLTLWFAGQSKFHPLPPTQSLGPWSVYRRTNATLDKRRWCTVHILSSFHIPLPVPSPLIVITLSPTLHPPYDA